MNAGNVGTKWAAPPLLAIVLVLTPQPVSAVETGKARYVAGTIERVKAGSDGPIDLSAAALVFKPTGAMISIPWASIGLITYHQKENAVAPLFSAGMVKVRRHYVGLSFNDEDGTARIAQFEFDKDDIASALWTMKQRTGRAIACENVKAGFDTVSVCGGSIPHGLMPVPGPVTPGSEAALVPMSGPRVRVFAPAVQGDPIVGEFVASDESTITIRTIRYGAFDAFAADPIYGRAIRLPRGSVTRFERSAGGSRKKLGAIIGGLVGLVLVLVAVEKSTPEGEDQSMEGWMLVAAPFAGIGAAVAPGERWVTDDPKRVSVRLGPAPGPGRGVGVRLSVGF